MKYIDEGRIEELLEKAQNVPGARIDEILAKSRALKRLTLEETAALLCVHDEQSVQKIFEAAAAVKQAIYGNRIVLFAPLYISNICSNGCLYCSFKADNTALERKALTVDEIKQQVRWLLERGHKRILMVAAESPRDGGVDYYVRAIRATYEVSVKENHIRRVNINCAPLEAGDFRKLKSAGIGTYQLFQETYHDATYRRMHPFGPKSDPDYRITAMDRAFEAGIDDVGIGVLYGLYDYRFETLAMLSHVEHLEKTHNVGPHTISVPRIEPAEGAALSQHIPHPVSDADFKKLVAVLRLAVPYTGIILSTRELPGMRDELVRLGVSQISAESRTNPGGYEDTGGGGGSGTQFTTADHRTLDEVIGSLIQNGFMPSFCAACYRKERTGETFMNLAKPGTIKEKCSINALITLKEYLDDFASDGVRRQGYSLIKSAAERLSIEDRKQLSVFFAEIDQGVRDRYV